MIPESFIQDLLARADIVDLIQSYVPLKKAGTNYAACCPFHNEKTASFTVSPNKQFYHCFGCGAHGTAISFLMEYAGLGFVEAVQDLANRLGMAVPTDERKPSNPTSAEASRTAQLGNLRTLSELMWEAARYYKQQLRQSPEAIAYLKKRGLSGEVAARFGVGYAPDSWQNLASVFPDYRAPELLVAGLVIENEQGRRYDRFRDRIIFPIVNGKGEVIGFGGRILEQGEPKYLNSPETPLFEKGQEVFGLPQARPALRDTNTAIVVEGYMDVVALSQHGIGNVVATLGTATTPTHVRKLLRQVDRLVFCFDGDNAGRKAAWRALENTLEALVDNKQAGFVFLPQDDDPDSFVRVHGADAFRQKVQEATPLSDFLFQELLRRNDTTSAEGRASLIHAAKPLLGHVHAPLLRLQLVKRLAELSQVSQAEVERLCSLRPLTRPSPARAPRQAPSLGRMLLQRVLEQPALALRLPTALPGDPRSLEYQALMTITRSIRERNTQTGQIPDYPVLCEAMRGMPGVQLVEQLVGEIMTKPLDSETDDETVAAEEFDAILDKFAERSRQSFFADLQAKARHSGVSGLSNEEKAAYLAFLSARKPGQPST